MNRKTNISIVIIVLLLVAGGIYYLISTSGTESTEYPALSVSEKALADIRSTYPDLSEFVDDIEKWQGILAEDETRTEAYLGLGLAWKSLADRTRADEHYKQALDIYEAGSHAVGRTNSILLANAGNMAIQLKQYDLVEDYYLEAIALAPGDTSLYIDLATVYEYDLQKPVEEIVAFLDKGIAVAIPPTALERHKESLLRRHAE